MAHMTKLAAQHVYAVCPVCTGEIPVLTIEVDLSGWFRRKCQVTAVGDATDYIAHMWTHNSSGDLE